jgi:hypothetical protein
MVLKCLFGLSSPGINQMDQKTSRQKDCQKCQQADN